MNPNLKKIQDLFQKKTDLNEQDKEALIKAIADADKQWAITESKLERTDKVKRTTAILLEETIEELEQKRKAIEAQNHELEIESSLERVRTVAMSMNRADDMLHVCQTITEQLELLKVKEIRNVQTAIFYKEKGTYMNYEYYAKHNKTFITETTYTNNEIHEDFANKMLKGNGEFMVAHIKGDEVKAWVGYQKTTNVFIDDYLYTASSLNYYWYSLGPVALGISTYAPLSGEETNLFKRFLKVFELSHRRYLDIEKAEAQAHEAKVEASLEKARAVAMSMNKPDDLLNICETLYKEFSAFGFADLRNAMINIHNDESKTFVNYDYSDEIGKNTNHLVYDIHPVIEKQVMQMRSANDAFSETVIAGKDLADWKKFRKKIGEKDDPRIKKAKALYYYFYSIGTGSIGMSAFSPVSEEKLKLLKRFRNVFNLSYQRYTDLALAETQAREAQIELALERIRARTMAMQKSDELSETVFILFQQFKQLGENPDQATIGIINEEEWVIEYWVTMYGNQTNRVYKFPIDEPNVTNRIYKAWKEQKKSLVIELSGKALFDFANFRESMGGAAYNEKEKKRVINVAFFSKGIINVQSNESRSADSILLLERFAAVFEQTYTRFLDLKKAEAQTREAQIELGLERVRARAMAMQKSNELSELVDTVFKELTKLDFALTWCIINIINENSLSNTVWAANPDIDKAPESYYMKFEDYPFHHAMMKGWKERKAKLVYVLEGSEKKEYDDYLFSATEFKRTPETAQVASRSLERYVVSFSFSNFGGLQTVGDVPLSSANLDILSRFGKVFDLTYTRFNDLQNAEAQARESQIEASLERVRSRSMAMQKSEELKEVIQVVYEQFVHLNIQVEHTGFIMDYKERDDMHIWLADMHEVPSEISIPYFDSPHWNSFIKAKEKGEDFFANLLNFEEKNKFYHDLFEVVPGVPEETLQYYFSCPGLAGSTVLLENIGLYIENFSGTPYTDEENNTLMRFGKVFQQTYTRFLDLQKAEAQARESQIEAALEKVRSRSLAMHNSSELGEVALLVYEKFQELGLTMDFALMLTPAENSTDVIHWVANPKKFSTSLAIRVPYFDSPINNALNEAFIKGQDFYTHTFSSGENTEWWQNTFAFSDYKYIPDEIKKTFLEAKGLEHSVSISKNSAALLGKFTGKAFAEQENDILKRFGKVFEQAYIRYHDLKKAEAQTREAHIEAALERVRSRSMGMQKSGELRDVIQVINDQLTQLNFEIDNMGFLTDYRESDDYNIWAADSNGVLPTQLHVPFFDHPFTRDYISQRDNGVELFAKAYSFEEKNKWWAIMFQSITGLPEELKNALLEVRLGSPGLALSRVFTKNIGLYLLNFSGVLYSEAENAIILRFGRVFEQTYIRFLDLKKAEAQALEAIKRASVDRVRAEIASMRTTNDLERITPLIWNELTVLGIPFIRCGVFIMDEEQQKVQTFLYTEGKTIASFTSAYSNSHIITEALPYWRAKEIYKTHWDEAAFLEQAKSLVEQGAISNGEKYLTEYHPTDLHLHFLPFLQGMLYVGDAAPLTDDHLQLVQALAEAFATAYARYEDFNKLEAAKQTVEKTLVNLKQTQAQLLQSEKMASLGELTAGIAHEIQNPLNFVNNFSEVSNELIIELLEEKHKAQGARDEGLENEILNDIAQNLEKINHHGKRADAIVKGMLQHSRSSTGVKEPTNINALADEYLRLAFHGLRAKDNSFNITMKTDFDDTIGKINVIPQDIGRIFLNLYNNAFYAVGERRKVGDAGFEPTVSVSTKKSGNQVVINVSDNGNGIPQKIADKIFQPFFTTKPTGQGTGLGLSLSYDIVKAHGGEIKVETREGKGSEFIIHLPFV